MNEKNKKKSNPGKSFTVAIEQMAQLLRSEVKAQEQKLNATLQKTAPTGSLSNTVEQIAKLLRTQITPAPQSTKKRSWSHQASPAKKPPKKWRSS